MMPMWIIVATAVMVGLAILHGVATRGTMTLPNQVMDAVAITPRTTLTHWWRHLVAGFFHRNAGHLLFNLALFGSSFMLAAQFGPSRALAMAYVLGPVSVVLVHLLLVVPLAYGGFGYAASAMDRPLVGFSVIAYATAGLALAVLLRTNAWVFGTLLFVALAFELVAGLGRFTGPFIFVYHLVGLGCGLATGLFWARS